MKVNSGYPADANGNMFYYEILNDGYKIYVGDVQYPTYHQYEPYIPDHTKSYEENAIDDCKNMAISITNPAPSVEERLTDVEANIDYLMLLNDPDSATEETAQ